jgi:phage-related protein
MDVAITFLPEAESFLDKLADKERLKILVNIRKTREGLRGEWFRKMPGTDEIWEFRTLFNKTYYRIFAFYDKKIRAHIVCTHGLVKKSDKTPSNEIVKAEDLRRRYLSSI